MSCKIEYKSYNINKVISENLSPEPPLGAV